MDMSESGGRIHRNLDVLRRETGDFNSVIERGLEKVRGLQEDFRIRESNFEDLYGHGAVVADIALVSNLRDEIARRETSTEDRQIARVSAVLEGMMMDQIECADWLGPNMFTQFASEYDDYMNGIDIIVERENDQGNTVTGIAIDVTRGHKSMEKKIQRIGQEVRQGTLSRIKYFRSEKSPHRGEVNLVPRVVVGVSNVTLEKAVRQWVDGANAELATDRIQLVILEEICMQLDVYRTLARRSNKTRASDHLDRQFAIFDGVRKSDKVVEIAGTTGFSPFTDKDHIFAELRKQVDKLT